MGRTYLVSNPLFEGHGNPYPYEDMADYLDNRGFYVEGLGLYRGHLGIIVVMLLVRKT